MSATLASGSAVDGRRVIIVAALMATYIQAATISLPNAALLYIEGSLSMSDDEVGWIFTSYLAASIITMTMARWLAGRYGRKIVYQISIVIFRARPCVCDACHDPDAIHCRAGHPGWRKRHHRSAVDGDPARYAAAVAACPHNPGGERNTVGRPPQWSEHRRVAQ